MADLKVKSDLEAESTVEKKKVYNHYIRSLKDSGGLPSTNNFNDFESNRVKGADGFAKVKAPDGTTIAEKLKAAAPPEAALAKDKIAGALKETDPYKNAKKAFNTNLANLNTLLQSGKYTLCDAGSYLLDAKNTAVSAIKAQHAQEKDKLTKLFDETQGPESVAFRNEMKTALGCSDAQLNAIKNEMISELTKSQNEELKKFEKSLQDDANKLFKRAEQEWYRLSFLGQRYSISSNSIFSKQLSKEIEAISAKANQHGENLSIGTGKKGSALLKNVDPAKLQTHITLSGKTLQAGEDGSLSTQFRRWFQSDADIYETITSMAEEMKARGCESITIRVNNATDPKLAAEIGRKAYESAILAGFDPKKITIEVNGEPKYKHDDKGKPEKTDLFKEHPQRLKFAQEKATQIAANRDAALKNPANQANLKNELQRLRQEQEAAEQAAPANLGVN